MAQNESRTEQLAQTITAIEKRWGSRAIHKAREPRLEIIPPTLSTGFQKVDHALGIGGLPRGRIIELIGSGTAGQVTLAAKTLCQAQWAGQQVVYVDVDHAVDLDSLGRCGVSLDSLVVLRPFSFVHALQMTRDLLTEGGVGVIVFDRVHNPRLLAENGAFRQFDRALREWTPILSRSLCTLIVLTETPSLSLYPSGSPLPHFASVRLFLEWQSWLYCGHWLSGFSSRVTVAKNKTAPPGQSVLINITITNHVQGE
jgi:recombination protein RecA